MGPWHPECPARLQAIEDQLIASRIDTLIEREEAPLASEEDLARVHTQAHIDFVKETAPSVGRAEIDPDTLMSPGSYHAALRAAGAAVAATDAVIAGTYDNAFCSVRPPGHHAEPARADGLLPIQQHRDRGASRASKCMVWSAWPSSISTCITATARKPAFSG